MLDHFDLPPRQRGITQIIRANGVANLANLGWQPIYKPRGMTFCAAWLINPGAGGGGGAGGAGGSTRGGGGGGSSGGQMRGLFLADTFPDLFYANVPPGTPGGAGGSSANGGNAASADVTFLALEPTAAAFNGNILMRGSNTGAGGGAGGTTTGGAGAAGTAAGAGGLTNSGMLTSGAIAATFFAGLAGTAGGSSGTPAPTAVALSVNGCMHTGGAGGAGCTATATAGANQTGLGRWQTVPGGAAGTAGIPGIEDFLSGIVLPFMRRGGTGGGSSNTVTGGRGGDAAIGCGGAGGGAGVTVGGAGGRGGDGLIILTWW